MLKIKRRGAAAKPPGKETAMTINEMQEQKAKWQQQLKTAKGSSPLMKQIRKRLKENIDKIDMMIFKAEAPEQFENYKNALHGYIDNTHIF